MLDQIDSWTLTIHIIAGSISLILFWIPTLSKKGGTIHRKSGVYYYRSMWVVLITSLMLSLFNTISGDYNSAIFLGYLGVLTGYPLWYSYEILQQKKVWSDRYYTNKRIFAIVLFGCSLAMLGGALLVGYNTFGVLMGFFGFLGLGAIRDAMLTKEKAMEEANKLQYHIQGTIISGIAAYTAFLAFGGRSLFVDLLPGTWQFLPWMLPTVVGVIAIKLMKKKYSSDLKT